MLIPRMRNNNIYAQERSNFSSNESKIDSIKFDGFLNAL